MAELDRRLTELSAKVDSLADAAGEDRSESQAAARRQAELGEEIGVIRAALRHAYEDDAAQRRRLHVLRESDEYEAAFVEEEPLVSFVIPTHTRFESLRDVSLPSILGQSYSNLEVIVSGDAAPPETEQMIAAFGDPRIRYCNRSVRGPYPDDKDRRWYVLGSPPFNDALALVRGRWIAALGDDDAVRPTHTEVLVRAAQQHRYEHCYGRFLVRYQNGEDFQIGAFPPRMGEFGLQTSLYHSGLRFFEMEPADYLYREPNDWSLCRRMLAAGVRFGMVDDILADKYESRYGSPAEWGVHGIPTVE